MQFQKGNKLAGKGNGLAQGKPPKGMTTLHSDLARYKRHLTGLATLQHGSPLPDFILELINVALTHEKRRRLVDAWLRKRWDDETLTTEQLLGLQAALGRSADDREQTVRDILAFTMPTKAKQQPTFDTLFAAAVPSPEQGQSDQPPNTATNSPIAPAIATDEARGM